MKKFGLWILGILAVILAVAFVMLFTPFGNGILKPYIQSQIDANSPVSAKLEVFELRFSSFNVLIKALDNIDIHAHGNYSLFGRSIDGVLNILIKNPSNIKELSSVNLDENFAIENLIRGKFGDFNVFTKSNIANGNIDINTRVVDFIPVKIVASIIGVKVESLLKIAGQKPYASGIFNLKADIYGDTKFQFSGEANAEISKANLNNALVKKEFNLKLPNKTDFITTLKVAFDGKEAKHNFNFLSQIGNITSSGSTLIDELKTMSSYNVNIADLSPFSAIAGMPLRGSFRTKGNIQGNTKWLNIDGKSDFASGNTAYTLSLENLTKPKDALVTINHLKIDEVLWTLMMPLYTKADMDAKIDVKQISKGISGTYEHTIKGVAQKSVLKKEFDLNPPNDIAFTHSANIELDNAKGNLNAKINSAVADFSIDSANIDAKEFAINAPYKIIISDLKKLAFVTSKELKGNIIAGGNAKFAGGKVSGDLQSEIFGGKLTAVFDNNVADIKLMDVKALSVLDMLQYPQMFDSSVNGKINYNILTQSGTMEFMATNGRFTETKLGALLKNTLNFNLAQEVYDGIKIDGKINKKVVNANLEASSKSTAITSKNAIIDFEKDNVNAYLNLRIKNDELGANISGKVSSPSISLDMKKLTKTILNKVLGEKKVDEIKDKVDSAKQKAQEKVDEAKQKAQEKVDEAKQKAQEQIKKEADKVGEQIENQLKNFFRR
ncbi:ATP synthase F0 subunit B [Helicobacter sp. 23-1045]